MDVLSDVLQVIRLSGAVLFRASFSAPWALITPPADVLVAQLPAPARRLVTFHVVVKGSCWVQRPPDAPLKVSLGEAILLPRCDVHVLADQLGRTPVSATVLLRDTPLLQLCEVAFGGDGPGTEILCGFLSCDLASFEPLFAALPAAFRVSLADNDNRTPELGHLVAYAVEQMTSSGAGAASLRLRLTELLFLEALRRYVVALPPDEIGWLAGLRDPVVGRALRLLHEAPCHPWTVPELAAQAAVSRSSLAARFKQLLGEAPMQYLTRWRLLLAVHQLQDGYRSIATVAGNVGYDSPAAFQRAFKHLHGETPAACRKRLKNTGASSWSP